MAIPDVDDLVAEAIEKFEKAATIAHDVANGAEGDYVQTESGPVPTLKEWLKLNEQALANIPALNARIDDVDAYLDGFLNADDPSKNAALIAWKAAGENTVATRLSEWMKRRAFIDVFDYMNDAQRADVQGGSTGNHTAAMTAAINDAKDRAPAELRFGAGKFRFTSLPNLAKSDVTYRGEGMRRTILQFTGTGVAVTVDAFASGSASDPFIQSCNLQFLTIKGNAQTTRIIDAQGIANYRWEDVSLAEAEPTAGRAFSFRGMMLGECTGLRCSVDYQAMNSKPQFGLVMDEGRRATESVGNSSNNTFRNCYFDGTPFGGQLILADQNLFIGGAFQSSSIYGLTEGAGSRYNIFVGTGFENVAATADFNAGGVHTQFIGCYASNKAILDGRQQRICGGYYENPVVETSARHAYVGEVTTHHWQTNHSGFVDRGFATHYGSFFNSVSGSFYYPKKDRAGITTTASPFVYTNNSGVYETVVMQAQPTGGTLSSVSMNDGISGSSSWAVPATAPGQWLLRPGDRLTFNFTGTIELSRYFHNGI